MKKIRAVSAALALAGSLTLVSPAEAQDFRQLGFFSSITAVCADITCQTVTFTLFLNGLQPTDNTGDAVPANILALGSPGYVNTLNFTTLSGGLFTGGTVTSGGTWATQVTAGGLILQNTSAAPFPGAPIVVVATFSTSGAKSFFYSGFAYLDPNSGATTGTCNSVSGTCTYVNGDFNGTVVTSPVPEPMTMGLMATGLVGLALVGYRRKKNAQV